MGSSVAAQLYTLREFTRTPADIARTLKKVRAIGYEAVQCSGLGPIETRELRRILDGEGLACCATHASYERMRDTPEIVGEEHRILGCQHTAIGSMPEEYPRSAEGYAKFAADFSGVAKKMQAQGVNLGYHNHSFELERFGAKTGLGILIEKSEPPVTFEIDTYWIQHGGGDPAAWIASVKGRIPLVHLKDMVMGADKDLARKEGETDEAYQKRKNSGWNKKQLMAEVGEGNLNWPAILSACRDSDVRWYIIEQDVCQRDPFESLGMSWKNLRAMGIK